MTRISEARSGGPAKLWRSGANCYTLYMYYVYILQSQKDKSFYTGFTRDLKQRVKDHNNHSSKYSSTKAPFVLIWYCAFLDKTKAMAFETYLKSSSGFAFRNKRLI